MWSARTRHGVEAGHEWPVAVRDAGAVTAFDDDTTAPAVPPPGSLFSLDGRVALVTGGTRGIGAMVASGLLAAGARVLVTGRDADEAAAAAARLDPGGRCTGVAADLATHEGIAALVEAAGSLTDRLHLLVNNAGAWAMAPVDHVPVAVWDEVLHLNVTAVHYLTVGLLPLLEAAATPADPARVVNISSIEGIDTPVLPTIPYSTSKAALHMLTRHHAAQLVDRGILVNAVAPGLFPTRMSAFLEVDELRDLALATIPLHRPGRAEEIAGTVVYLASRAGGYVTGQVLAVDGGRTGIGRADPVTALDLPTSPA
jgi:NAD(P)-dependent dehydrogenase (short-subunit alcohol dehydrogenase family)